VNLDDTHSAHPFAKMLPFLSWLYDHSTEVYVWATNLVVLQAVLKSGLEYPLFYRIWHKPETKGEGLTKIDLAKQMLLMLRDPLSASCGSMDRCNPSGKYQAIYKRQLGQTAWSSRHHLYFKSVVSKFGSINPYSRCDYDDENWVYEYCSYNQGLLDNISIAGQTKKY
jgi:hypothetical protein